ncbi:hypothetical protein BRD56_09460 [Thermoplasmatales archaeon SW_10_69_26]|nr:MAG: hypothetical protein BRD56_09460 [Thermoplasmatales archaeon SW_10_69_26]
MPSDNLQRSWSGCSRFAKPDFEPGRFATPVLIENEFTLEATAERLGDTTAVVEKYCLDEAGLTAAVDPRYEMPRSRGRGAE